MSLNQQFGKIGIFIISKPNLQSNNIFLHLHEIVEGLYFYSSLSVSVRVSVCVCLPVCPFVNKMPIESLHRFWRGLR